MVLIYATLSYSMLTYATLRYTLGCLPPRRMLSNMVSDMETWLNTLTFLIKTENILELGLRRSPPVESI
jgi:hypothetical protein